MTLSDIERLEALADKATPELWMSGGDFYATGRVDDFITACDPQRILALCALARRGLASPRGEAVALYDAIKHGDEVHREWLREALECWYGGRSIPPARSADLVPKISGHEYEEETGLHTVMLEVSPAFCVFVSGSDFSCAWSTEQTGVMELYATPDAASPSAGVVVTDEHVGAVQTEVLRSRNREVSLGDVSDILEAYRRLSSRSSAGAVIQMELHCPFCHEQHIDEGEWETRPHKTHLCVRCEHQWRPANVPTVGVRSIVEAALAAAPRGEGKA